MFVTLLASSYGVIERGVGSMLTMLPTPPFSPILYRRARIMEDYGGCNFAIPNDDDVMTPEEPSRRVRPRQENVEEDPPVIPVDDEMPIDWYNVEVRRYQDDLG